MEPSPLQWNLTVAAQERRLSLLVMLLRNKSRPLRCLPWIAGPLFYIPVMLSIEADPQSFDLSLSSILSKANGSVWHPWKNSTLAWEAS